MAELEQGQHRGRCRRLSQQRLELGRIVGGGANQQGVLLQGQRPGQPLGGGSGGGGGHCRDAGDHRHRTAGMALRQGQQGVGGAGIKGGVPLAQQHHGLASSHFCGQGRGGGMPGLAARLRLAHHRKQQR